MLNILKPQAEQHIKVNLLYHNTLVGNTVRLEKLLDWLRKYENSNTVLALFDEIYGDDYYDEVYGEELDDGPTTETQTKPRS